MESIIPILKFGFLHILRHIDTYMPYIIAGVVLYIVFKAIFNLITRG